MNPPLQIVAATPQHAQALLQIYEPYVLHTAITFEYDVPTVQEFARRIATISARFPYLVAMLGNKAVGYAYANTFKDRDAYQWAVETSIYIHPQHHRQGIGKRLYDELEAQLKKQGILNMNACISFTDCANDPLLPLHSVDFHRSMGFVTVAHFHQCGLKFNRWYDMIWMEKLIGPHTQNHKKQK
ncbi:MAG: GNAT family N-acetyltransferase [Muribaculaceae bacterium]